MITKQQPMGGRRRGHNRRRLKIGKGSAFVKSRLKLRPQTDDVWEADLRSLPDPGDHYKWFGMVISQTSDYILADALLCLEPTVNDLAQLLADAIERPLVGMGHRPARLHLCRNHDWDDLLPHLAELKIEVTFEEILREWDEAAAEMSHHVAL